MGRRAKQGASRQGGRGGSGCGTTVKARTALPTGTRDSKSSCRISARQLLKADDEAVLLDAGVLQVRCALAIAQPIICELPSRRDLPCSRAA